MGRLLYIYFLILFIVSFQKNVNGQSSYRLVGGILVGSDGNLPNLISNDEKKFRIGYQAGINANFGTYNFIISPGIFYRNITIDDGFKKIDPFVKTPRFHIAKSKIILSYQADLGSKKIKMRLGGGANGSYLIMSDLVDNSNWNVVNDVYYGYNFDFGFDFYFLTFLFSYEKSLIDTLSYKNNNSRLDFFEMSVGIIL